MKCQFYTESEISRGFPLEKCGHCPNNKQDSDDGIYTCQLVMDEVYQKADMKGEEK